MSEEINKLKELLKDKIPRLDPPLVGDLIEKLEKTSDLGKHDKVRKRKPEVVDPITENLDKLLEIAKPLNDYSYFVKLHPTYEQELKFANECVDGLNQILTEITKLNCITKFCREKKLLEKLQPYLEKIEELQKKLENLYHQAEEKLKEWLIENNPLKEAQEKVMNEAKGLLDKVGGGSIIDRIF